MLIFHFLIILSVGIGCGLWLQEVRAIFNGIPIKENGFPFMVAIFDEKNLLCGGTIVTETVVLTACRCL